MFLKFLYFLSFFYSLRVSLCRSAYNRTNGLLPEALALSTLNRLIFSLIPCNCCMSSRNTLWFKKSSEHEAELEICTVVK